MNVGMGEKPHPTWVRFGREAKRLRVTAGIPQDQLARSLNISPALLSAIERGTRNPKRDHAEALDAALDTGGALTRLWMNLANQQETGDWFRDVEVLEQQAIEIREYQSILVPGLLQTERYMRAVIRASRSWASAEEVDRFAEARLRRIEAMMGTGRRLLWFVVDETIIRRIIGSPEIAVEQLEHLRELMDDGAVRFQVIPFDTRMHPGLRCPFRLMSFDDRPSVVYAERLKGGDLIDDANEVREANTIFGTLQAEALSPSASDELIRTTLGELR